VDLDQPQQDALPQAAELGGAGVPEQAQVEDPQGQRGVAAPGELGARRVECGRGLSVSPRARPAATARSRSRRAASSPGKASTV
jgi:hypothetical protein